MALPTVCYLLLMFSMLPLFSDAWTHCSRRSGSYCPAGSDCNRNNSLCEYRSENSTEAKERREECDEDIILRFTLSEFVVSEGNGPATPVIQINKALNCCSFSVIVLFEQLTADNNDYYHPSRGYERVIFSAGKDTAEMPVKVKDDDIVEISETFKVTIVKESLPHGVSLAQPSEAIVVIRDNDIGCVSLRLAANKVTESTRAVKIDLRVDNAASFDYNVTFGTTDLSANKCDYAAGPHTATFKAGRKTTSLYIDIIDDDMHEGSETFNFFINSFVAVIPAHQPFIDDALDKCYPHRGAVTINDDEGTITVRFDKSSYRVDENVSTFSPELKLSRPSPCCATVYIELIELMSSTAATGGGDDYGHSTTTKYEYVFPAGEICAVPVNPIPITDDRLSERDERFNMRIMPFSLPLGFTASTSFIPVTIKDNDIEICFSVQTCSINENSGQLKVRFNLNKPAKEDLTVEILQNFRNSTPQDYDQGLKFVTFNKNSQSAVLCIDIYPDDNNTYTGNRIFDLIIDGGVLPTCLVPCTTSEPEVTCTIIDNEYTVCFSDRSATVEEGESVDLTLSTSRRLSSSVSVRLNYTDVTTVSSGSKYDYTRRSTVYVSSSTTFSISTRNDRTLEYNETFTVSIPSELIHPDVPNCITTVNVTIVDNDYCSVEFEKSFYPATSNKNILLRPKLKLSNPIAYPIQVTLLSINGTATRGCRPMEDYCILQESPITIRPEDGQMKEFAIRTVDDDIVESPIEYFFVNITYVANGYGGVDHRVTIGEIHSARFLIRDDDMSYVSIIDERLVLSKEIYSKASIEICYFEEGRPPFISILPQKTPSFDLGGPVNEIKKIKLCIPQDILRRVTSRDDKVEICTLQI